MRRTALPIARPASRALLRVLCSVSLVVSGAAGVVAVAPIGSAQAAGPGGGEIVLINSVEVKSPLLTTQCNQSKVDPVVPVTIEATFITTGNVKPTGPYAVSTWSGGTGTSDQHFGTGQGHSKHQTFHVLEHILQGYYHGQGEYDFNVIVQDVGLAGGFATKSITAHLGEASSYGAGLHMKCPILGDLDKPSDFANAAAAPFIAKFQSLVQGAIHSAANEICAACTSLYDAYQEADSLFSTLSDYNDTADTLLNNVALKDPPDPNFQQVATPVPAPVLDPPGKLSPARQDAARMLYTRLAAVIGDACAMSTTINRAWGAGNAGDNYWYRRQLDNLATVAAQASGELQAVATAYAAFDAAFAGTLAAIPTPADVVSDEVGMLSSTGLPAAQQAGLKALGNSPSDIADIADYLSDADPNAIIGADAAQDLLAPPVDYAQSAGAFDNLRAYATSAAGAAPPVVTGLDTRRAPSTGGTTVTLHGTGLASVTGVDFGPSTTTSGQGTDVGCTATACTVTVPSGSGTVPVVAIGPGGPSAATSDTTLTYDAPSVPTVTGLTPATGATAGGTQVQVHGGGFAGGQVWFGPEVADASSCSADTCTATAPESAHDGRVDVTVAGADGTRSSVGADDVFTYVASPAPPVAPAVTSLSAHSGSDLGSDGVTITGAHLGGATAVQFGGQDAEDFDVRSDGTIVATSPALDAGTAVDVAVYGPGGTSAAGPATHWTPAVVVPAVTSVSPSSAPSTGGATITVHGTGLNRGTVAVDGSPDYSSACTATDCTVQAPPHSAGAVSVTVNNLDGTSPATAASAFTYTAGALPTISRVSPDHGTPAGGTPIAITGTGLAGGQVSIDGLPVRSDDLCSATYCLVYPAAHTVGSVDVVVTTPTGDSRPASYTYEAAGPPSVTSVYPTAGGAQGITTVTVFGTNLRDGRIHVGDIDAGGGATQPLCDDTSCTVLVQGDGSTGPHDLTVTTAGGTSAATATDRFTFTRPTVTSVAPNVGWTVGGQQVVVHGTGLADGTLSFGTGAFADGVCQSDTTCTVTVPQANDAGPVDVTAYSADGGTTSTPTAAGTFTYRVLDTPTVTSVSPAAGTHAGGDTVTVSGHDLYGGSVSFGADQAADAICGDTSCTASAPVHDDGTVDVTVATSVGTSATAAGDHYRYAAPAVPTITGLTPASGSAAGGTAFVLTGSALTRGSITVGGVPATDVSCTSASRCTGLTPTGVVGAAAVRVSTEGGTSGGASFTYLRPAAPTVTGVMPARGPRTGGSLVTVTGTNLGAGAISFGGVAGTDAECGDTECTVLQPAGATGAHDVTVTTAGGSVTDTGAFTDSPLSVAGVEVADIAHEDGGGGHVTTAPDGTVWFTLPPLGRIGHVTADGHVTTFAAQDSSATVIGVAITGDGRVWYTESDPNTIVSVRPDGTGPTTYAVPGARSDLRDIVVGPDGKLWFTLGGSGALGVLDPADGSVHTYPLSDPDSYPVNLTVGPDGRIWFSEADVDRIGAITTGGKISEYRVPDAGSQPWALVDGPDGRVWFTERAAPVIGAISVTGQVTRYGLGDAGAPIGITSGVDGRLWVTEAGFDQITAVDPSTGATEDVPLPTFANVAPRYLATAGDGSIWVSEFNGSQLAHVTGVATGVTPAVTAVTPGYAAPAGGTVVTVTGANVLGATSVSFDGVSAPATVVDATHVRATAPAHAAGSVTLAVVTPHGNTPAVPFRYGAVPVAPAVTGVAPTGGSTAGGTAVTVTGTGLAGAVLRVGGAAATAVTCSDTTCTATTPAGSVGSADIVATTGAGSSAVGVDDRFAYRADAPAAPTVTGISPSTGPAAGGTAITVTGANLAGGIVDVGGNRASAVTCTATSCTGTTPPGNGTLHVTVQTAGGTSIRADGNRFTYGAPHVPAAPGRPSAVAAATGGGATITFTPAADDGGSPVLDYTVTAHSGPTSAGSQTVPAGGVLHALITGLHNGTAYTFTVAARNAAGTSVASPASAAVIPRLPVTAALVSPPHTAVYGRAVAVHGVVRNGRSAAGGCDATLQLRRSGSSTWSTLGRAARSAASGALTWTLGLPASGQLRLAVSAGMCASATSAVAAVAVQVHLTAALSARTVKHGRAARVTGSVAPGLAGRRVFLQRLVGRTWHNAGASTLSARSGFTFTVRPTTRGRTVYRVVVGATSYFVATASGSLTLRAT